MSIQGIFNNSRKDEKKAKAYDQVKTVFSHCISGLTEEEVLSLDPYLLGFDQNDLIEHELIYVEKNNVKEAAELGIDLKELRRRFKERTGYNHIAAIKYYLDSYISDEELKRINAKLKEALPDVFPFGISETQLRVMAVWGRESYATEDDIAKTKEMLNLDYEIKSMKRG